MVFLLRGFSTISTKSGRTFVPRESSKNEFFLYCLPPLIAEIRFENKPLANLGVKMIDAFCESIVLEPNLLLARSAVLSPISLGDTNVDGSITLE